MPLCEVCQNLNLHDASKFQSGSWGLTRVFTNVQKGANEVGCDFCRLIYRDVEDLIPQISFAVSDLFLLLQFYHFPRPLPRAKGVFGVNKLQVEIEPGPRRQGMSAAEWVPQRYTEYIVVADPGSPAAVDEEIPIIGRYLGQDPKSVLIVDAINQWIGECKLNHPACTRTLSNTASIDEDADLPTRCIDVSAGARSLRLRETSGTKGQYITVSHRWHKGITEASETISTNYADRLSGKCFGNIPQTFRDAIEIACLLNVRYIWIDSLCIIQNSADWAAESLRMADYFQNALLNIAITEDSPLQGFLGAWPDRPFSQLVRLPYRQKNGTKNGHLYIYKPTWHVSTKHQALVTHSELMRRAWVFQEWLLCRRILFFTPNQLFLECSSSAPRSEGYDPVSDYHQDFAKFKRRYRLTGSPGPWYRALRTYSRLSLTRSSDRVIALAGVAREMRESFKATDRREHKVGRLEYVSGLWLRDIHHGLLWEAWNPNLAANEQCEEIQDVPSWSWASILTEVIWSMYSKGHEFRGAFDLTKVHSTRPISGTLDCSRSDITTSGSDGGFFRAFDIDNFTSSLLIHAKMVPVRIGEPLGDAGIRAAAFASGMSARIEQRPKDWRERLRWRAVSDPIRQETLSGWASLERLADLDEECIYALHVASYRAPEGLMFGYLSFSHPVYCVLFLIEADDGAPKYRRLGVGRIYGKGFMRKIDGTSKREVELV